MGRRVTRITTGAGQILHTGMKKRTFMMIPGTTAVLMGHRQDMVKNVPMSLRRGSGYYWCHTDSEGNWDYCSPDPILGVHVSAEREFTRYGQTCRDKCSEGGKSYGWCQIYGRNIEKSQAWEYCSSKGPGTTIYGASCSSKCKKQGTSYFWCQTKDSWDYCSPDYMEWRRSEATLKSQSLTSIFITFAILNASKLF